jgi:hypothetical protein
MDHVAFIKELRESRKTLEALKAVAETSILTQFNMAQLCEELIKNNQRVEIIAATLQGPHEESPRP